MTPRLYSIQSLMLVFTVSLLLISCGKDQQSKQPPPIVINLSELNGIAAQACLAGMQGRDDRLTF